MRTHRTRFLLVAALVAGLAPSAGAQDAPSLGQRLYDVLAAGLPRIFPGFRINHAKGIVMEGTFSATPDAAHFSKAAHFKGEPVKLTIRYSNAGGIPDAADNAQSSSVRAMAFTFEMPDGASTDLMAINMPVFITKTPEEFITFNKAAQASGPGAAQPTPVAQYIGAHPETKAFITTPRPMPVSYGTQDYYTIHAYRLVNAAGEAHFVRFHIVPETGTQFRTADEAAAAPPNALIEEIIARVAKAPVSYRLLAQIAAPGDPTNDPTLTWPDSRPVVEFGRITVTKAVENSAAAEKKLGFLPNRAVPGFEMSDDPFLAARAGAYAVAYPKRQ